MPKLFAAAFAFSLWLCATTAGAQLEALEDGFAIGEWYFRPSIELRVRGEFRHRPADTGGDRFQPSAVLADGYRRATPPLEARHGTVDNQWLVSERARIGLAVEWETITGVLRLQDARVLGVVPNAPEDPGFDSGGSASFGPYEAYLDFKTKDEGPTVQVRLGRQRVVWGDGRLLGDSDWSATAASLDAARFQFRHGDFDWELLGALLSPPGALPPAAAADPGADPGLGTGAQLYGLRLQLRIVPVFNIEAHGLARIAREPLPSTLTPSDIGVFGGRLFGDHRGFEYAVEGAYELGRVASFGVNRDLSAFAVAARAKWQTSLPWDLAFRISGAYASGAAEDDNGAQGVPQSTLTRFDPVLPTVHTHHGLMDLYAWSNLIEGGGGLSVRPVEELLIELGGAFVGLAEPTDRWSTAALLPVGAAPDNGSHILGGEVDLRLEVNPWDWGGFAGGYGLLVLGDGGRAVLAAAGRGEPDLLHYAYLQAKLAAP